MFGPLSVYQKPTHGGRPAALAITLVPVLMGLTFVRGKVLNQNIKIELNRALVAIYNAGR